MTEDIRWKQRFENYDRAYLLLAKAGRLKKRSDIERAGLLQFFEMSIELAWKMLKDYLQQQEQYQVNSPRETIKQAFQAGLIENGEEWLNALNDRNLIAHTYDEAGVQTIEYRVTHVYFPMLEQLHVDFLKRTK
jgi:nucleotidyltransferase substrate binding protein (TIGR01987 family)